MVIMKTMMVRVMTMMMMMTRTTTTTTTTTEHHADEDDADLDMGIADCGVGNIIVMPQSLESANNLGHEA
ncbi:hypothetical protein PCANC_06578 [Puccinia coronata f. sp. avenae]|uniref:Secreted protein n=1 Tax=Puccinia coronata f. sp. avenae TaxID=200324 RepID=A0A2N5VA62_9BASI|nr:hypothetical protein PCANC_06578 [Puccinia coronata f. sp. avenae]